MKPPTVLRRHRRARAALREPKQVQSVSPDDSPLSCVLCGGRGGWWTGEFREQCPRCQQTGWEPSPAVRAVLRPPTHDRP